MAMTLLALAAASCGGPARREMDPAPIALTPPTPAPPPRPAASPARPRTVAVWAHVDQPDVLLDVLGVTSSAWPEIARYAELLDLRQPIDVMFVADGGSVHDIAPALRLHFKDSKALFALVSTDFQLREDGDRVFARSRRAGSTDADASREDEWECDFVRGSDAAVCGAPKAVSAIAEWSKSGPQPPPAVARAPLVRLNAYGESLLPLVGDIFGGTRIAARGNDDLRAFLADAERFSIELAAEGDQLHATALWRLRSQQSRPARDLLAAPNAEPMPEIFHRVVQESGTAVFVPGGGAMPKWIAEILRQSQPLVRATSRLDDKPDPAGIVGSFTTSPAVIGWGMRVDRARTALGAVRVAKEKDQERAIQTLEDALQPQLVYALAASIGAVEQAIRGIVTASSAGPSGVAPGGPPSYRVRPAPAALGLPKTSFVLEARSVDWARRATTTTNTPPIRVTYTLFASAFDGVLGVTCPALDLCAEAYRRLTSKAPGPRVDHELFHRGGLVASGWASSSSGVQAVHRIMLETATPPVPPDILANLERDLLAPRFKLPFVVTTAREGAGGTVSAEMRGSRDAFRAALDQGLLGSSWGIARMLLMLFGGP